MNKNIFEINDETLPKVLDGITVYARNDLMYYYTKTTECDVKQSEIRDKCNEFMRDVAGLLIKHDFIISTGIEYGTSPTSYWVRLRGQIDVTKYLKYIYLQRPLLSKTDIVFDCHNTPASTKKDKYFFGYTIKIIDENSPRFKDALVSCYYCGKELKVIKTMNDGSITHCDACNITYELICADKIGGGTPADTLYQIGDKRKSYMLGL
jgi:hypothetical protein